VYHSTLGWRVRKKKKTDRADDSGKRGGEFEEARVEHEEGLCKVRI